MQSGANPSVQDLWASSCAIANPVLAVIAISATPRTRLAFAIAMLHEASKRTSMKRPVEGKSTPSRT